MLRFIIFFFEHGHAKGGWKDILRDSNGAIRSFETEDAAHDYLPSLIDKRNFAQIIDTHTGLMIGEYSLTWTKR